jgi:hypothetical protein
MATTEGLTINQPTILDIAITSTTALTCHGMANGAIDLDVTGGTPSTGANPPYMCEWTKDGTAFIGTGTCPDLTGLTAGTYSVTVTDGNWCTATETVFVNEPDALITTTTTVPDIICYGGTRSVTLDASGGTPPYGGLGPFTVYGQGQDT